MIAFNLILGKEVAGFELAHETSFDLLLGYHTGGGNGRILPRAIGIKPICARS